ncbi:hypothetical protein SAMD00019534_048660 [Acytostelium subglobosum LB1]|uniref:hypothetical protein n=1 Tax=Acytostelium subglobosum LB1 TaxID=1410327 RepID=UPI000644FF17|nr:hypothetical protein SAMD00019534_048660 [Acytostelium subglobosum LB1]GAM21691.1 hypothetical protein SAMD00019534_048660 [Acytostelium subglobosum LB1]|eukprot:XP_012755810.1 hypothetical protein SAMD00019534_048660 [Acytostelium subglobosum LB1]
MVGVLADVVEVVVLATGTDALLTVGGTLQLGLLAAGVSLSEEDWLELIHTSVGKQQRWVIMWHHL